MTDLIPAARPVPSPEDRMRDARTDQATPTTDAHINLTEQRLTPTDRAAMNPGRTFRSWLSDTDRDQLDARAAAAEQERDDALDERDDARRKLEAVRTELGATREESDRFGAQVANLRAQLDRTNASRQRLQAQLDDMAIQRNMARTDVAIARTDVHHDIARQIDILAADPGILRDWLTTCDPQPISFGELFHALAEKLRRPTPPSSVPPRRAQEESPYAAAEAAMEVVVARLTPYATEPHGDLRMGPKRAALMAVDAAAPILLAAGRRQATAAIREKIAGLPFNAARPYMEGLVDAADIAEARP